MKTWIWAGLGLAVISWAGAAAQDAGGTFKEPPKAVGVAMGPDGKPAARQGLVLDLKDPLFSYAAWACSDGHANRVKPHLACRTQSDWHERATEACAKRSCGNAGCKLKKLHVGLQCKAAGDAP